MKSQGSHIRSCSVDRSRYIARQRSKAKPEIESALAIYEAKLDELDAASEVIQQQIIRWRAGLAEWKAWLGSARQQQAMGGVQIERSQTNTLARGRCRLPSGDGAPEVDAVRRYHLAEASKCLTTDPAGELDESSSDDEENRHPVRTQLLPARSRVTTSSDGRYVSRSQTVEESNPKGSAAPPARSRPPIPKLGLSNAVGHGSWLGGEQTQGDTYKGQKSPSSALSQD